MASALITLLLSLLFVAASSSRNDEVVRQLHWKWMAKHRRSYNTLLEEEQRLKVFKDNLRYIDKHNTAADRGEYSFMLGLTPFVDLTNEEFRLSKSCFIPSGRRTSPVLNNSRMLRCGDELPESVDWRALGAVTSVKNQGSCGATEEEKRLEVFKDNLRNIDKHNVAADRGEFSFQLGLTNFVDLTNEEFRSRNRCFLPSSVLKNRTRAVAR